MRAFGAVKRKLAPARSSIARAFMGQQIHPSYDLPKHCYKGIDKIVRAPRARKEMGNEWKMVECNSAAITWRRHNKCDSANSHYRSPCSASSARDTSRAACRSCSANGDSCILFRHLTPIVRLPTPFSRTRRMCQALNRTVCILDTILTRSECVIRYSVNVRLLVVMQSVGHDSPVVANNASICRR